jgi:deoxyribodipyrimidine photo-lyase
MRTAIVWLRRDLRLTDNPALAAACEQADRVLPLFVWSPHEEGEGAPGAAQRWWLYHSLRALNSDLHGKGSRLLVRAGDSLSEIKSLADESCAEAVFWNRAYEPAVARRDAQVGEALETAGLHVTTYVDQLLHEPGRVLTANGKPFRVFTPFWKACLAAPDPAPPARTPEHIRPPEAWPGSHSIESLGLLPDIDWYREMETTWTPGEKGAWRQLETFVDGALAEYGQKRDYPAIEGTSRLSPHLHFGEISPRSVWQFVSARGAARDAGGCEAYLRELGWREFAHHVLWHFPETVGEPMNPKFAGFPWRDDGPELGAWKRGETGIPIVDAGMRQLWRTGWMHNRVRMIVASLLVKNLGYAWRAGANWFRHTLVDADLANNTMGWQWSAGCGADAAPFFRIFNPVLQGERFDPDGSYVRRYVPELGTVPPRFLHKPWEMPPDSRRRVGFELGRDYPQPIVDLQASRKQALEAFRALG